MTDKKIHLDIDGMHCSSCASGIQLVTEGIDGVKKVVVHYDAKSGDWDFDDTKTSKEAIVKEVESLGYRIV
ncbi:MAG: hypothetical protein UY04_C0029G0009 [Parcubacteria group bacterium GW2011_GWA2_47_7]|nr:MAG: hypothetical protein UY04_C0029G0009 [Parcubacteria group bacterium GW2011_GWA2_47_7]